MLHAKSEDHRTSGFGGEDFFTIYGHGGRLGHVTLTVYKLSFPLLKETPQEI